MTAATATAATAASTATNVTTARRTIENVKGPQRTRDVALNQGHVAVHGS